MLKNPRSLTLKHIAEAIQGPYHLIKCLQDKDCCGKYEKCPVRMVLEKTEKKILEVFDSFTINDLISWKKKGK